MSEVTEIRNAIKSLKTQAGIIIEQTGLYQSAISVQTGLNQGTLSILLGNNNGTINATTDRIRSIATSVFECVKQKITDEAISNTLKGILEELAEKFCQLKTAIDSGKITAHIPSAKSKGRPRTGSTDALSERSQLRRNIRSSLNSSEEEQPAKPAVSFVDALSAKQDSHCTAHALENMRQYNEGTSGKSIAEHIEITKSGITAMFTAKTPALDPTTLGKFFASNSGGFVAKEIFFGKGAPKFPAGEMIKGFVCTFKARPPYDQPDLDTNFENLCKHLEKLFEKAAQPQVSAVAKLSSGHIGSSRG